MRRAALVFVIAMIAGTLSAATQSGASAGIPAHIERFLEHERTMLGAGQGVSAAATAVGTTGAVTDHFRILGHVELPADEIHADVFFYDHGGAVGKFAYVGSWGGNCAGTGVNVIDVNDPENPVLVTVAGSHPGESHEDMVIRRIGDRDIMAVGVQQCGDGGRTGMDLFDITDPASPTEVSFFPTPGGGVHELDVVVRPDGKVLALLAVPFVEFENTYFGANAGGEFRIVDVTDPEHPAELSSWGIIANSSLPIVAGNGEISSSYQGIGYFAAYFDHSVRAADDGMTAYVSYWDGGVLKFDISDPANPKLLARTTFPFNADGDAHSLATYDYHGDRYILQNDEDGEALSPPTLTSTATGEAAYTGIEEPWAPTLLSDIGPVTGAVFDAGGGCRRRNYWGSAGKIVIADSIDPFYVGIIDGWTPPPCPIGRQALFAKHFGAIALISNLVSPDDAYPYFEGDFDWIQKATVGLPVVQISDIDGEADAIRAALAGGTRVQVSLKPAEPTHGSLRVFREGTATDTDGDGILEYSQVGGFSDLPNVTGSINVPPGSWEIHNTEVIGTHAYSSWYSNGIVALSLRDPSRPRRIGQFVPPPSDTFNDFFGAPFPLVWGVAIDPDTGIIYASDMRSGLWIVEPTGDDDDDDGGGDVHHGGGARAQSARRP
jgi:hypothetical protein